MAADERNPSGLENRVDVTIYANPLFSWQQMKEIRVGLEDGLDVTPYRKFIYTAADMKRIRKNLVKSALKGILESEEETFADNRFVVRISADEMEASVKVECGTNDVVSKEEIVTALMHAGVTQGII